MSSKVEMGAEARHLNLDARDAGKAKSKEVGGGLGVNNNFILKPKVFQKLFR